MMIEHSDLVYAAKTIGLLLLMALFIASVIYAYWPSHKADFEKTARSIIDDEDRPA
ncbi:MAG: cbb3-type cytochrome oxidase subunit 3 [Hyphomicrobiaceae bacterium]